MTLTRRTLLSLFATSALWGAQLAAAQDLASSPAPDGVSVRIIAPADGETVPGEFTVVFGLSGMGVAPAGVQQEGTGHHHLLVDGTELPPANQPMGNPPIHFGGGQTETTLMLEPGEHTLQLILGNHLHVPFEPSIVSEVVTVTVK